MAPFGTIYSWMPNPRVLKIQAVAKINGLEIAVPDAFQMGVENCTKDFLKKFPTGKVPAFEGSDGTCLVESDAIAFYLAQCGPRATQLLGGDSSAQAKIMQWVCFQMWEIWPPMQTILLKHLGLTDVTAEMDATAMQDISKSLAVLERHLEGRTWLATGDLSLADISVASALYFALKHRIPAHVRNETPNVVTWYMRTLQSEGMAEIFGEPDFHQQ